MTAASHTFLALATMLVFFNAVSVRLIQHHHSGLSLFQNLEAPLFLIGATIIVERLYYVMARLLQTSGVNLWEAHPAPEILSLCVAGAIFWLSLKIRGLARDDQARKKRVVIIQTGLALGVFIGMSWGLW